MHGSEPRYPRSESLESRDAGKLARPVRAGGRRKRTCIRRHLADGLPAPCGTRTPGRRSSRSAPGSPTRPRSGSTGTSGPSVRHSRPGSGSPRCPTGSPPAMTRPGCRRSATGCSLGPSRSSPSGGCTASRCLLTAGTGMPGTGGSARCGRSRFPHRRVRRPAPGPVVLRGADR